MRLMDWPRLAGDAKNALLPLPALCTRQSIPFFSLPLIPFLFLLLLLQLA